MVSPFNRSLLRRGFQSQRVLFHRGLSPATPQGHPGYDQTLRGLFDFWWEGSKVYQTQEWRNQMSLER